MSHCMHSSSRGLVLALTRYPGRGVGREVGREIGQEVGREVGQEVDGRLEVE